MQLRFPCNYTTPVGLRGHGAVDNRDVDTRLLPYIPVLQDAGDAATSLSPCPCILAEFGAIDLLDCLANGVLSLANDPLELGLGAAIGSGYDQAPFATNHDRGTPTCYLCRRQGEAGSRGPPPPT